MMIIIRIVRMHIIPEKVDEFLEVFDRTKEAIRNVDGCIHLELLRDAEHINIFTTLSHWNDKSHLETYRGSELFKNVWSRVKPLFSKSAEAFSLAKFIEV